MSAVHRSEGRPSTRLSQPALRGRDRGRLARAVLGSGSPVPWELFASNYDRMRDVSSE